MIKFLFILLFSINCFAQQDLTEIINFGAENGKTGWKVENGASLTVNSYTVPSKRYGKKYFTVTFGTSSVNSRVYQEFQSPTVIGNGRRCYLSVTYRRNDTNADIKKLEVGEVGFTAFSKAINLYGGTGTFFREVKEQIPCPGDNSNLYVQIRSTTLVDATIDIDNIVVSSSEQRNYYVEASIRSTSGSALLVDYQDNLIFNVGNSPTMQLAVHQATQDANPWITCVSGIAASGGDCGANDENIGIDVVIPISGIFKVCANFSYHTNATSDSGSFRISRTARTNTAETVAGNNVLHFKGETAVVAYKQAYICESFSISSNTTGAGGDFNLRYTFRLLGRRTGASATDRVDILLSEVTATLSRLTWTIERVSE